MHFESGAKLIRLLTWTCSTELQNFKESCLDWRLSPLTGPPTVWCYCSKIRKFLDFYHRGQTKWNLLLCAKDIICLPFKKSTRFILALTILWSKYFARTILINIRLSLEAPWHNISLTSNVQQLIKVIPCWCILLISPHMKRFKHSWKKKQKKSK